jgi:hypothetical protein
MCRSARPASFRTGVTLFRRLHVVVQFVLCGLKQVMFFALGTLPCAPPERTVQDLFSDQAFKKAAVCGEFFS